jgi:hypothetical protein
MKKENENEPVNEELTVDAPAREDWIEKEDVTETPPAAVATGIIDFAKLLTSIIANFHHSIAVLTKYYEFEYDDYELKILEQVMAFVVKQWDLTKYPELIVVMAFVAIEGGKIIGLLNYVRSTKVRVVENPGVKGVEPPTSRSDAQ